MKLGIMQPYFFPYIGYWQLMNAVDTYVVYDDVNYIKRGWINRNRILVNGKPSYFNIQLKEVSQFKLINEIEVINDPVLKNKMLKTLALNYKKAPYFNDVYPIFEEIIMQDENNLAKYLTFAIKKIASYLDMNTKIIVSSEITKNNALKGQDKILHICKLFDASEYYNAIGGQELYEYEKFEQLGIKLSFLSPKLTEYKQFNNEFVEGLSIIDVMMFNDKDKIKTMLNNYELIRNDSYQLDKILKNRL